jgi:hypothetical protein
MFAVEAGWIDEAEVLGEGDEGRTTLLSVLREDEVSIIRGGGEMETMEREEDGGRVIEKTGERLESEEMLSETESDDDDDAVVERRGQGARKRRSPRLGGP